MDFCSKCGSRLLPKKDKTTNSVELVCLKCGSKKQLTNGKIEPRLTEIVQLNPKKLVAVISKEEQKLRTLPTVRIECPKCGNKSAYVWQVQTRSADESSTQFHRCTKCTYTFREYT